MRLLLLTTLLLVNTVLLASQIDVLRQQLSKLTGTKRMPVLLQLCDTKIKSTLANAEALKYGQELFQLANSVQDTAALVEACLCIANNEDPVEHGDVVRSWLEKAEKLAWKHPQLLAKALYWQAGFYNELGKIKTCLGLLNRAYQVAKNHRVPLEQVRILSTMANIYSGKGKLEKADSLATLARRHCKSDQDSAIYFSAWGAVQENFGHLDKALSAYLKAYRLDKKLNNLMPATRNLQQSAAILRDQRQYKEAIPYLQEAIDLSMQTGNLNYLSATYHTLAILYIQLKDYYQALHYYKRSLAIKKEIGRPKKVLSSAQGIAELYFLTHQYDSCLALVKKYLPLSQTIKMQEAEIDLALIGSRAAAKSAKPQLARHFFGIGEKALLEVKAAEELADVYHLAAVAAADVQDFSKAYHYQQLFQRVQDSLYTLQKAAIIAELDARFNNEKKEQQIRNLAQDNLLQKERIYRANLQRWGLVGGLFMLAISALALWRSSRTRWQQNLTLTQINQALNFKNKEVETLLREVHHRVKNNLQIISSLLRLQARGVKQEDAAEVLRVSQSRVQSIALLHQRLYQGEGLNQVPLRVYLQDLIQSLQDTYQMAENQIQVHVDIDDVKVDVDLAIPLGLITNELIINSIKHAFPARQTGSIELFVKKSNERLVYWVKDNGIGIKLSEGKPLVKKSSFGLELVESLVEKIQASLTFSNGQGTRIELLIPLDFSQEPRVLV